MKVKRTQQRAQAYNSYLVPPQQATRARRSQVQHSYLKLEILTNGNFEKLIMSHDVGHFEYISN